MSVQCPDCGAVASYGNEIGHKNNCPYLFRDFSKLKKMSADEIQKALAEVQPADQETIERRLTRD